MIFHKALLACLAGTFLASSGAFAKTPESSTGTIEEGVYQTAGESPYKDGRVELSAWGPGFEMTAQLVRGERLYDVEVFYRRSGPNRYRGEGEITVTYDNGRQCIHKFGSILYEDEGQFFLRENTPRYIPYRPNTPCGAASRYVWYNHEAPYIIQD